MKRIALLGPDFEDVDYGEIKKFLEGFGFKVQKEEDFLLKADVNSVAERIARIRVLNPDKKELNETPFPIEIEYEVKNLWEKGNI